MDLQDLRLEIDDINKKIVDLLCRRMDISVDVAKYKTEHDLPVLNTAREDDILRCVKQASKAYNDRYEDIIPLVFSSILDSSRALQYPYVDKDENFSDIIENAQKNRAKDDVKIVCQGTAGAFSHIAALSLFEDIEPSFVDSFEDVFESVKNGDADYGIVPVENSNAGSVNEVYDLIINSKFYIIDALTLPVEHCLVVCRGAKLADITDVYSHPQALSQCAEFLKKNHMHTHGYVNTAVAAKMIADSGDITKAAIASKLAAQKHGLDIVAEKIQNSSKNCTRFVVISRDLVIPENANKISLTFALPHITGSLYRTLSRFAMAGLNLTKLESRPLHDENFTYLFYLDFEGSIQKNYVDELMSALSAEMEKFTFLGHYHEIC